MGLQRPTGDPATVAPDARPPCDPRRVFVGRQEEMARLHHALRDARGGAGRITVIAGPAGIGKTCMAHEFAADARRTGAEVLVGRCLEAEGTPGYWPWIQVVRGWARARSAADVRRELRDTGPELARIVPDLRQLVPDLPETVAEASAPLTPAHARFRVFDAITQLLCRTAGDHLVVVVLEDVHWADPATLLLLQFLGREIATAPLVVVATYRPDEIEPAHPLVETLAELAREPHYERLHLGGLAEVHVRRFMETATGHVPDAALVRRIHRESGGNPLFVREMIEHLARTTAAAAIDDLPQGLREAIGRRVGRLPPDCRRVLTMAAVLGREFSVGLVGRLTGLATSGGSPRASSSDRLLAAVAAAANARLVDEVPGTVGRFRFEHALVRETLYRDLNPIERVRLHGEVATALEQASAHDDSALTELAYHAYQAAPAAGAARAVDYAMRAGARAMETYAYESAAEHYGHALELLRPGETTDDVRRCDALLGLGVACMQMGARDRAGPLLSEAIRLARGVGGQSPERAALSRRLAEAALTTIIEPETARPWLITLLEEALEGLPEGDSPLRVRILGRLAWEFYWTPNHTRREALSTEAIAMARRLNDPLTLAYALNARHYIIWGSADLDERLRIAREIMPLADRAGDPELSILGLSFSIADHLEAGDMTRVRTDVDLYHRRAAPHRLYAWLSPAYRGMLALLEGHFHDVEPCLREVLERGQRLREHAALHIYGGQMLVLRREQGRLEEMVDAIATPVEGPPVFQLGWRAALAFVHAELGRLDDAHAVFDECLGAVAATHQDMTWTTTIAFLAETCAALRDRAAATRLYDALLPFAGRNVGSGGLFYHGPVDYYLGLLATVEVGT